MELSLQLIWPTVIIKRKILLEVYLSLGKIDKAALVLGGFLN